jgi:hypothetical protein
MQNEELHEDGACAMIKCLIHTIMLGGKLFKSQKSPAKFFALNVVSALKNSCDESPKCIAATGAQLRPLLGEL